jgi:hypothetical protein
MARGASGAQELNRPRAKHDMVKIISGGQTGIDRAVLDVAIELGLDYGGWCPNGGWAEDLPNPPGLLARYNRLRETPLADPLQRTEWNIRDAGRVLLLVDGAGLDVSQGTVAASEFAVKLGKPHSVIDLDVPEAPAQARGFLAEGKGDSAFCVAGPRESEAPGIYAKARPFLCAVLTGVTE